MITEATAKEMFCKEPPITADIGEAKYIPIEQLENQLDALEYSTRNFQYQVIKDGYANLVVMASIEVCIMYTLHEQSEIIHRSFVGGCNFPLLAIAPNQHFIATAKSECMKNAASDIAKYFGRSLNAHLETPDTTPIIPNKSKKLRPDDKILKQFEDAIGRGDESAITMIQNIYEIKTKGVFNVDKD